MCPVTGLENKEFEILGMKEGEKVHDYFAKTFTIANKMKIHGEKMEHVIVEKISS